MKLCICYAICICYALLLIVAFPFALAWDKLNLSKLKK